MFGSIFPATPKILVNISQLPETKFLSKNYEETVMARAPPPPQLLQIMHTKCCKWYTARASGTIHALLHLVVQADFPIPTLHDMRWWCHFFNFHPHLGKQSNLTKIFQTGWNPPTRWTLKPREIQGIFFLGKTVDNKLSSKAAKGDVERAVGKPKKPMQGFISVLLMPWRGEGIFFLMHLSFCQGWTFAFCLRARLQ